MEAILRFETERATAAPARLNAPALLFIGFGALLTGAGVLLLVGVHWAGMSPALRFLAMVALVVAFHLAGAGFAAREPRLATAFHGLGTVTLGAGIYLAGQIFNLEENWAGGALLWALGAWCGVAVLRDWVQATLAAALTPLWLACQWAATPGGGQNQILAVGLLGLSFAYLGALPGRSAPGARAALVRLGGLGVLPAAVAVVCLRPEPWPFGGQGWPVLLGWTVALGGPVLLAGFLRGARAWPVALAVGWSLVLSILPHETGLYLWSGLGFMGLAAWGLRDESRERVNRGVAGFALTVLGYYFQQLGRRLDMSLSLLGLGLLLLGGGWALERLRRRLNARIGGGAR